MFQMLNIKGNMTTPVVVARNKILLLWVIDLLTTWIQMGQHLAVRMTSLALEAGLLAILFHLMTEALSWSVLLPHAPRILVGRLVSIPAHQETPIVGLDPLVMVLIGNFLADPNGSLTAIVVQAMIIVIKKRLMHPAPPQSQNSDLQRWNMANLLPAKLIPVNHLYQAFQILAPKPALIYATRVLALTFHLLLETLLIPDFLETPNSLTLGLIFMKPHLVWLNV
jgi:hypothetical protein